MWKRLQGHGREKEKQIGNPVLLETTYDEDHFRRMPTVTDVQTASHQPNSLPPGAPQQQQYNTLSPHYPGDNRVSEVPTVSSIYSQPSPELRSDYRYAGDVNSGVVDVSPPSSPEPDDRSRDLNLPRRFRSMRDVSPVDENRQSAGRSAIPVLRKAPPALRDNVKPVTQKFWGGKVAPNSKVKWDEYSGEPTSSKTGKSASVNPKAYAQGSLSPPSTRRPLGNEATVTAGHGDLKKATTLSDRAGRFGKKPAPVDMTLAKPREPWRGASGRAEIVQPFKHQAAEQSPTVFRKVTPILAEDPARDASSSLTQSVNRNPVPADTAPVADDPAEFDTHEDPIKPTPPLKVGRNSPPRSIASPTSPHNPGNHNLASPTSLHSPAGQAIHSYPSPITPTNNHTSTTVASGHAPVRLVGTEEPTTPTANTKVPRKSIESTPGSTASRGERLDSRFSWTTYNTSTTYQHSPPPSPPPPLPTHTPGIPQQPISQVPANAASSILNRKRPIQPADKVPARKPVSTATISRPLTMASSDPPSPRPMSTFSTATQKALPRPPTEVAAADHIEILESQMDDLRIRRSNVYRLLTDLNNMAPPNPLITDFKRARLVERRKKDFEDELAEIRREEHDVGLRLHRAWRKRERADPNGSESAIWIRRVTS